MGNLIIKRVSYIGDKYKFISPEFSTGINIVVGDNGSGKTTFSYFIEYGLGGTIKAFEKGVKKDENFLITGDNNNYVLLDVGIDGKAYTLKRFIGINEILIGDVEQERVARYALNRNSKSTDGFFSDWLLKKLGIEIFELHLGINSWTFNFNDLYRLLCHDQNTETSLIYKNPVYKNHITDSLVIRKSIFETLVGLSSDKYLKKLGELRTAEKTLNVIKSSLKFFLDLHPNLGLLNKNRQIEYDEYNTQLSKLLASRKEVQENSVFGIEDKEEVLANLQGDYVKYELDISSNRLRLESIMVEKAKVARLKELQEEEIQRIEKIIFAHHQLDIFSLEICPFCGSKHDPKDQRCICGSEFEEQGYQKFVYSPNEYKEIIDYKRKSMRAVDDAMIALDAEIEEIRNSMTYNARSLEVCKRNLNEIISTIRYNDNSSILDNINSSIFDVQKKISDVASELALHEEKSRLEKDVETEAINFKKICSEFEIIDASYQRDNKETITTFSSTFEFLMKNSSCKVKNAQIDSDYMPVIDNGAYREHSAKVPIRLMYYFSLLSMGMMFENVKHPRFLIVDTPETAGIDANNLNVNFLALDKVVNNKENIYTDYQVIITTGKYPDAYKPFVKLEFNTEEDKYVLEFNN